MDKEKRNAIDRATRRARKLLEDDFASQLEGTFDVLRSGEIATKPGTHLSPKQVVHRQKIVAAIEHKLANGMIKAAAVADYLRDAAFTTLNRFVALKMTEARELAQECITKGEQSAGYREFCGMAPGVALLPDSTGYRLYIESLFDELSTEVKVLFNRRDAASILWPKRACFEELLTTLNVPELSSVWDEDETIGWIYQYYNCDDVSEMRKAANGGAPRNSRELAVRNQFFTPRYVVEFLTDNTLGRLWYEMMRGETTLRDRCCYLVRRPTEIFLKPGETAPESTSGSEVKASENLSQEELLRQPVHIPHRPLKDPREIRLLDPACGSMHFGLYAFDLFTVIYDEAWEIAHGTDDAAKSAETFAPFVSFAASFPEKVAFLGEMPRLIVEHNIHGIDIDPRAAQIAGLSLWLRAQRAWHQAGVKPNDHLRITHSNIVCAEPMPGEKELLREFIEQQFPAGERPAFAFLLEKIFDRMTLAGEAGSLLRIEEEIRTAIAEARALAKSQSAPRQARLFAGDEPPEQAALDLRGLNDEQFWQAAEQRIYDALEAYAEQAENGGGFQRRLFAGDAAQGFAFIDLCRKRYDVVVMNPPFGELTTAATDYVKGAYPLHSNNILCAFLERYAKSLQELGRCGCVLDRTILIKNSYETFRRKLLLESGALSVVADLGWNVLDANVEVSTLVLTGSSQSKSACGYDVTKEDNKGSELLDRLPDPTELSLESLGDQPFAAISFQMPEYLRRALRNWPSLSASGISFYNGHTIKSDVFKRLVWEVPLTDLDSAIFRMWNGSEYSPYYVAFQECVIRDGYAGGLLNHRSTIMRSPSRHLLAGLCFGKRGEYLDVQILPPGFILTNEGFGGPTRPTQGCVETWFALALLNSLPAQCALNFYCGQHKGVGYVNALPFVGLTSKACEQIVGLAQIAYDIRRSAAQVSETDPFFIMPFYSAKDPATTPQEWLLSYRSKSERAIEAANELDALFLECFEVVESERDNLFQSAKNRPKISALCGLNHREEIAVREYWAHSIISYGFGCVFGRWDIRYATGERPALELPDPFAPLPVCPPGMLQGADGLPLSPEAGRRLRTEGCYPLDVAWDGILVDDSKHPLDLERRVHAAFAVLWGDRADALEQEVCAVLGVPTLREWFRRPTGFFADHLKRYSKSRRHAPIYWPLSTASGSYTLWLYYHRFSKDSLYKALEQVQQKLLHEEGKLARLASETGAIPSVLQRKELATQEQFLAELRALYEELFRVTPLWNPDLNDGVIINYGPLWRMIAHNPWQKAVKSCWDELVSGNYDWAHLAMHHWPERVVPKCATDRSLAIAHGLEEIFWEEDKKGKWITRATLTRSIEELVRERSSPAVKAALKNLLDAPVVKASKASTRSRSRR